VGKSEEQRAECGECALSYKTGRVALQPCFSIRQNNYVINNVINAVINNVINFMKDPSEILLHHFTG